MKRLSPTNQNNTKITNVSKGTAAGDAASFNQLPVVSDTAPSSPAEGDVWFDTSVIPSPGDGTVLAEYAYPNNPPTPLSGAKLFARYRTGRRNISFRTPNAVNHALQNSMFANSVGYLAPSGFGSTTLTQVGFNPATVGSATSRTFASTVAGQMKRIGYVSAAAAASQATVRGNTAMIWRGNAAKLGGFLVVERFSLSALQSGMRAFAGISATIGALANADPTTLFNLVGVCINSTDNNWRLCYNDASGTATNVDLGTDFPKDITTPFELRIYCDPNGSFIGLSFENLATGALVNYELTTDIPANTISMAPHITVNTNAATSAVAFDLNNLYVETDY